ncbi:hypothetical protein PR048_014758 [Dryococelus australis]|uniref:Transposable element P transposase-like GTP-binding insertion domain-containing protein n=1 Tax=Dryococelus australis TaxID=614101 RepID=A0ABQ9HF81_9NEOP|nr:hypothetical protein PR048_014758 [Dryococelus australis]
MKRIEVLVVFETPNNDESQTVVSQLGVQRQAICAGAWRGGYRRSTEEWVMCAGRNAVYDDAAGRRDFSGISSFPPLFHSVAVPFLPHFTLIGAVMGRPILSIELSSYVHNCAAVECKNWRGMESDIVYHGSQKRCTRNYKINVNNAQVCSVHFAPEDYERDLKNELLGLLVRKKLRPNAVNSVFIRNWHGEKSVAVENITGKQLEILSKKNKIDQATSTDYIPEKTPINNKTEEINRLKKEVKLLKQRNVLLPASLAKTKAALKKAKITKIKGLSMKEILMKCGAVLSKCFTPGQIRCLLRGNRRVKWSAGDSACALTLRALSKKKKNYVYLRKHEKHNIPLASRSTLQQWTREYKCKPGVLNEVLCLMKAYTVDFSEMGKMADLSFDVEASGVRVVAVTCDMGSKNAKVWKELCVNMGKTFFINPVDSTRKLWVLYDTPHLLKLPRNHFLGDDVTLPDGTKFTKYLIRVLLDCPKGDLSISHQISETHLTLAGRDRQNVRMAARLFSRSTAQALNYVLQKKSRKQFHAKTSLRSGYGLNHQSQENALKRFLDVCVALRFGARKNVLTFQKEFIISIKSLIGLYEDMKKDSITYSHF